MFISSYVYGYKTRQHIVLMVCMVFVVSFKHVALYNIVGVVVVLYGAFTSSWMVWKVNGNPHQHGKNRLYNKMLSPWFSSLWCNEFSITVFSTPSGFLSYLIMAIMVNLYGRMV